LLFLSREILDELSDFGENVSGSATLFGGLTVVLTEHGRGEFVTVWVRLSAVGEWGAVLSTNFTLSVNDNFHFSSSSEITS
jgi:hypothetical protein